VFDRPKGQRRVTLTPAGEVLLLHAEKVMDQLRKADAELQELDSTQAGTIRVGSFQSVSVALLPPTLARVRRDRPSVVVVPTEIDDEVELQTRLAGGDLDLAFLVGDLDDRFSGVQVLVDPFRLVAPRTMDLPAIVDAGDLADLPMVAERPGICQDRVDAALTERGLAANVVFRTGDNGALQSMVRAGIGVAVMPTLAVDITDVEIGLHELIPPMEPRVISIAKRAGDPLTPAGRAFIDAAMVEAERLTRVRPMLIGPQHIDLVAALR
jgi:DNA-binding transcriptional LysR family regulator